MAFGSIELTTISRAQDLTPIKQNEDNKNFVNQTHIGQQMQKDTAQKANQVRSSDNADWHTKKFDAREKCDNEYEGDGGKKRKQSKKQEQVVVKGRQSFDMKI